MGKRNGKRKPQLRQRPPKMHLDAGALRPAEYRNRALNLRLTEREQGELRKAAKRLGLTITDYLLGLHAQAWEQIQKGKV